MAWGLLVLCFTLAATNAATFVALFFFAKRAEANARAAGAANVVATKREGELVLADRKVDEASEAVREAEAARDKADERGDVLEKEISNASDSGGADAAVDSMRLREVEVDVGDSRQ